MPQKNAWEKEYKNPQLIKLSDEPRKDLVDYMKFLRKKEKIDIEGLNILDLGSGNGKNANYLAELGNNVTGFEISTSAAEMAKSNANLNTQKMLGSNLNSDVTDIAETETLPNPNYILADIGASFTLENESMDLIIDIMSSNSLNESEREIYLNEVHRVLKHEGHFFLRGLCKDGDQNAKNLIKLHPGKEYDTYINQDMNLTERVFSKDDFIKTYSKYFEIQQLTKKTNYALFKGQSYKRNYWLAYMKKSDNRESINSQPKTSEEKINSEALIVDVREYEEIKALPCDFPNQIILPMSELQSRFDELPKDKEIVIMCHSGARSQRAADFLLENGYPNVSVFEGGMVAWMNS
jgi:rhodanese-related sulfurtransferase/ubiquinone/menaquinone biosynthesis C-methylase UbiE